MPKKQQIQYNLIIYNTIQFRRLKGEINVLLRLVMRRNKIIAAKRNS